ncbi:MAG: alpha-hydroxy-acid oxidizing protein, partial [Chloroflexi bacterium]|nr:alpha-hydroxy-acid oxidizing protein [Chloroflexota bacterium]
RQAFDRLAFRPRVLVDVSQIDTSTTLLGHGLRIPVMLAPVGGLQRFTPDGGVAATRLRRRDRARRWQTMELR